MPKKLISLEDISPVRPSREAEKLRYAENTHLLGYYKARSYAQQRNYRGARQLYSRFVRSHEQRDQLLGDALSRLGNCYWLLDNHRMADLCYRRALACQGEIMDTVGASWTRIRYAELEWKMAKFEHAHALVAQSLADFEHLKDHIGVVAARQLTADIYYWQCKFADAERSQVLLVDALPTLTDSALAMPAAIHRLAEVRRFQGKLIESLENYEHCRRLYEALPPGYELGWTLAGLGDIFRMQGDAIAAFDYANQSLAIFSGLNFPVGIGWATRAIGEVLRQEGKYGGAVELYDTAIAQFQSARDSRGVASCVASKAEVVLARSDFDSARQMFAEACASLRQDESWYAYARALRGLAAAHYAAGKLDDSSTTLDAAVEAFRDMGNSYQVKLSGLLRGKIQLTGGDPAAARSSFRAALEGCKEAGDRPHAAELRSLLGLVVPG